MIGCCKSQGGETEVVCGQGETESQSARSSADIEGEGDGEDDRGQEERTPNEAEDHRTLVILLWVQSWSGAGVEGVEGSSMRRSVVGQGLGQLDKSRRELAGELGQVVLPPSPSRSIMRVQVQFSKMSLVPPSWR